MDSQGVYIRVAASYVFDKKCANYLPCAAAVNCGAVDGQWEKRIVYSYGYCADEPAIACRECPGSAIYITCYVSQRFRDSECTDTLPNVPMFAYNSGKCY